VISSLDWLSLVLMFCVLKSLKSNWENLSFESCSPKNPSFFHFSLLSLEVLGQMILTDLHRFSGYLPLTKFSVSTEKSLPGEGSVRTNGGRDSVPSENCHGKRGDDNLTTQIALSPNTQKHGHYMVILRYPLQDGAPQL